VNSREHDLTHFLHVSGYGEPHILKDPKEYFGGKPCLDKFDVNLAICVPSLLLELVGRVNLVGP
jgi:hypothetical protein